MRWRSTEIDRGEPSWITSSMSPMSMPSSSEAVATTARIAPVCSRCSTARRVRFDSAPWCAATVPSPSRFSRSWATRSDMRRLGTKISVVRCSPRSTSMRA